MSLPFLAKKPLDIPPIVSVELIQITEKTNIPFAPKAKKIIEKVKEDEKKLVSEQAPPKKVKKTKTKTVVSLDQNKEKIEKQTPEAIPLPDKTVKKIETKIESKQNPDKLDELDNIAKLIDKAKEDTAKVIKKNNDITQDQDNKIVTSGLTLSEEDALKAQIFGCWSIPLGLPYNEDLLVRIKLMLEPDGSVGKTEILAHARMNKPGQGFYKVLAESALRAVKLCQPLRVPSTGYERWKELQLNFDAREMLEG